MPGNVAHFGLLHPYDEAGIRRSTDARHFSDRYFAAECRSPASCRYRRGSLIV